MEKESLKKRVESEEENDLRPEYDFSQLKGGVRGKMAFSEKELNRSEGVCTKSMNRIIVAITLIGILNLVSFAQNTKEQISDKPTFTGTWEFENKKSYNSKNALIINHVGDELTLTESLEYEGKLISNKTTLYSDQRGERNLFLAPGADSPIEVKSKTRWNKAKLIRKSAFSSLFMIGANRYRVVHEETQIYSLSKDGNFLTLETIAFRDNPFDDKPRIYSGKKVFRRKN